MALYKFKVYFEDNDEVYRIIEVKSNQTFQHLHEAILSSVAFDSKHDASFYMSDDTWRKGQEITNRTGDKPKMKDAKLNAFINDPHQKILYTYDFNADWSFCCELTGIVIKEDASVDYPHIAKSVGKPPKQYNDKKFGEDLEEDEFDYITRNLLKGDVSEEELGEHAGFGADENAEDENGESDDDGMFAGDDEEQTVLDED